jgi:hypothetical protein
MELLALMERVVRERQRWLAIDSWCARRRCPAIAPCCWRGDSVARAGHPGDMPDDMDDLAEGDG